MKLFKKLAISVHSQVENLADRFENKESLSTAYIREYERVVAGTKVRLAQVTGEVARLEREAAALRDQEALWAERARKTHTTDEAKALQCVARMNKTKAARRQIMNNLEETKGLQQKMSKDVDHILSKLERLKRTHRNLSSRQVCAEASNTLHGIDGVMQHDIDDLFESLGNRCRRQRASRPHDH